MLFSKLAVGVNVVVLPPVLNVPLTGAPVAVTTTMNVELVSVALFIASENVANIAALGAIPVAALAG